MITVAIPNISEMSEKMIQFIFQVSTQAGLQVEVFMPTKHTIYKKHKRISLKRYIDLMEKKNQLDLLIIKLTKQTLEKGFYQHVPFHIVVLPSKETGSEMNRKASVRLNTIKRMQSGYYVLPKERDAFITNSVTYGWHKEADVSASSAQVEVDGGMQIQCCMGGKEFSVNSKVNNPQSILAGIAILRLYGVDLSEVKKES